MRKLLSIFMLFIFTSCGNNVPSASDSNVKKLVLEICTDEFKNQLTANAIITELGMSPNILGNPSYTDLKKNSDEDSQKVLAKVDEQMAEVNFELNAIRKISIDEKIGKIRCAAELRFNSGNKIDIEYTAQYTDDGELYVVVYGLR